MAEPLKRVEVTGGTVVGGPSTPPPTGGRPDIAVLTVNGYSFQDWETIQVWHQLREFPFYNCRFTTSEGSPLAKDWAALRIRPGDFCTVTLGGFPAFSGKVEIRQVFADAKRHHVELTCATRMEVATSSVISKTMEWKDKTFGTIARDILGKMGINVKFEGGAEPSFKFPRASAEPGQSVLSFLDELSRGLPSKGLGISFTNNIAGDFVVIVGPIGGTDQIVEGKNALILREVIYNIAQSGAVPALGQRPGDNDQWGAKVASVPFFNETIETFGKPFTPSVVVNEIPAWANDVLKGRAGNTGRWSQSDQITVTATVQGWIRPSGGLWLRGQTVNVTSPMLLMDGDPLIAKTITFTQDNAMGTRTTLELCNELALGGGVPKVGG
jgi:prophage tail gpP-like protein